MTKDIHLHAESDDHTEGLIQDLESAIDINEEITITVLGNTYHVIPNILKVGPGRPTDSQGGVSR